MTTQNLSTTDRYDSVITHPAHPALNKATKNRFASRVLELTGVLQTTLETHELLAIFAKEIQLVVPYGGLSYEFPGLHIEVNIGVESTHSCAYQLVVLEDHLGNMKFTRNEPFQEEELESIECLLAGLLYPLRNSLLYQRAVDSATTDPLTGIKNRAAMNDTIKREIGLLNATNPLCPVLFSISITSKESTTHTVTSTVTRH